MDHAGKMNSWAIKKRKLVIINHRGNNLNRGFLNTKTAITAATSSKFMNRDI
jgi:hypothetical protein